MGKRSFQGLVAGTRPATTLSPVMYNTVTDDAQLHKLYLLRLIMPFSYGSLFIITPSPNQGGGGELFYSQIIVGSSDRHCLERALVGSSVLSDNELGLAISEEVMRRLSDVSKPPK